MSSCMLLYSSHRIIEEELAEVILQSDGMLTPEPVIPGAKWPLKPHCI